MKVSPVIFRKNYTRDTTLLIQELWPLSMEKGIEKLGIKSRFSPVVVDFINHGTVEIWENEKAVKDIKDKFAVLCKKEPEKAVALLRDYQSGLKKDIYPVWQKRYLNSRRALQSFIARVQELMVGDLFLLYVSEDKRVKGKIKALTVKLRAEDKFFVTTNQVFKKSLIKIFPQLKDYVSLIRISEIDKPPSLSELKKRAEKFIAVSDGYYKIQTIKEYARSKTAKERHFVFLEEKAEIRSGALTGKTANPGRVSGRAKIVFSTKELDKVKTGDIIVSPMTTADMMPALRRAAAFVTDEGGIICHAAIVARELGKPCLIATKGATQAFKDNDLIEVDTYRGIVRKIGPGRG